MESTELSYDELVALRELQWEKDRAQQRREWDAQRWVDQDADKSLHGIWVIYIWTGESWTFAGFRRRRKRRKPQTMNKFFAKVRRRLEIEKQMPVLIMDLHEAILRIRRGDTAWLTIAPTRRVYRAPMLQRTPKLWVTKHWRQRAKIKAFKLHKKETRFIAIGRNRWERTTTYLYLGPLKAASKLIATNEARKLFPVYNELLVIDTRTLSEPLRLAMHRGKTVKAGQTRLVWPEVPPTFEEVWHRFLRWMERQGVQTAAVEDALCDIEMALRVEWARQQTPWLTVKWMRKVLKSKTIPLTGDKQCAPKRKPAKKRAKHVRRGTTKFTKPSRVSRRKVTAKRSGVKRSKTGKRSRSQSAKRSGVATPNAVKTSRRHRGSSDGPSAARRRTLTRKKTARRAKKKPSRLRRLILMSRS